MKLRAKQAKFGNTGAHTNTERAKQAKSGHTGAHTNTELKWLCIAYR